MSNLIWRLPFAVYVKLKLSVHDVTSWVNFHFAQTKTLFICGEDTEISTSMERIGVTNSWRFKLSKTVPSNTRRITWDRRIPSYHIKQEGRWLIHQAQFKSGFKRAWNLLSSFWPRKRQTLIIISIIITITYLYSAICPNIWWRFTIVQIPRLKFKTNTSTISLAIEMFLYNN